jgi:mannose-1-phosphate guanylyltransferase
MTFERLCNIAPKENIFIVTNEGYVDLVKEQLPSIEINRILTEPKRKNTAPCIAYAAAKIYDLNPNATLVVAPSDHLILKEDKFTAIINIAIQQANSNERLVTLGIQPSRPDTGYGYIEFEEVGDMIGGEVKEVKHFREKPNKELAEIFVKAGNFYWNSGIFIWKASSILNALKKFNNSLYELFSPENGFYNTDNEQEKVNHCFHVCEDISIDFAVMENAKNVDVVLANFDWSDLGTWGSLYTHLDKDYNGNAVIGEHVHMINSSNCIVNLPSNKLALIEGMNNYIIVESDNMLMILNKSDEQNIKEYMFALKEKSPTLFK